MQPLNYELMSSRARLAGALLAFLLSVACLTVVVAIFASASGELDPVLAKVKATPAGNTVASAVASKTQAKTAKAKRAA